MDITAKPRTGTGLVASFAAGFATGLALIATAAGVYAVHTTRRTP